MRIYEVGEVLRHARGLLERDAFLADLWVHGEITSLSQSPAGHVYFGLRDGASQLRCVLFRSMARHLTARLVAGQAVVAHGSVTLYEAQSTFQLIADLVQPEGLGLQHLQSELLRRRLANEGLFAPERKRPLPLFPRRIGVVTSTGGAVIHDILRVLERRYPLAEVVFAPSPVQGDGAASEIVAALSRLNELAASRLKASARWQAVDVIILARGGGAPEELAVFNEESIARAIFASAIPVVSAIGHETDYTIADDVADLRAPTPSIAAELVAPDATTLRASVVDHRRRLASAAIALTQAERHRVASARQRLSWHSPELTVQRHRQRIDHVVERAQRALGVELATRGNQLAKRRVQLEALSPLTTLGRGYALCYDHATGGLLTAVEQAAAGQSVDVQLRRGVLHTEVQAVAEGRHREESRPPVGAFADGWSSGGEDER